MSPQQREVLLGWRSWGGVADVFDNRKPEYQPYRAQLRELLSDEEYRSASSSILTAFFTDPEITKAMWSALEAAGVTSGQVLEPGCGHGSFIDTAPAAVSMTGVELDPTTAEIARVLHPEARVLAEDFTDTAFADSTFDAVIGNVPFSQSVPRDTTHNQGRLSLHNYVIAKSIALTQPGGYVAVVTSTHTADAQGRGGYGPRAVLCDKADFITGVRLPSGRDGAFAENAGTEVGTDILVFRVREDGREPTPTTLEFLKASLVDVDGQIITVNDFFASRPENILGHHRVTSGRFGPELAVDRDHSRPLGEQIAERLGRDIDAAVDQGLGQATQSVASADLDAAITEHASSEEVMLGTVRYRREAGEVIFERYSILDDSGISHWGEVTPLKKYSDQWVRIIDIKETTVALLAANRENNEQVALGLRARLGDQYDAYVEQYGPLNLHEVKLPRAKSQNQIDKAFAALSTKWRKANAVYDRPFEGELPSDVFDELMDEARQPTSPATKVSPHLEGALKSDPMVFAALSIELYNEDTRTATKGPLFTHNPIQAALFRDEADSLADAIEIIEGTGQTLNSQNLAALLPDYDEARVVTELEEQRLAFRDPHSPDEWIIASAYLSGAVRTKLRQAEVMANDRDDDRFAANVEALRAVQPEPVTEGITMNLGATWIPYDVYEDFVAHVLQLPDNRRSAMMLTNTMDSWQLNVEGYWPDQGAADLKWGVCTAGASGEFNYQAADSRMHRLSHHGVAKNGYDATVLSALEALELAFNSKAPKLNYSAEAARVLGLSDRGYHINGHATQFAGRKVTEIREYFQTWCLQDPERYNRLVEEYNNVFNNIVSPQYDGSARQFPGLSTSMKPYAYQRNAVERIVHEPGVLLNHVVGAGKTGSMIMGAMELKRLGKVAKPALVVPNHLVEQITREAYQWYPGAQVLSGEAALSKNTKGATAADARRMLSAQIATYDWDLVILPESVFERMPMSSQEIETYIKRKTDQLRADLETAKNEKTEKARLTAKNIQKAIDAYESQQDDELAKAAKNKDTGLSFDELGIDYLIVDEAHGYKNLQRVSPAPELSHKGSAKATDIDMKIEWLRSQKRPGQPVVTFATGTPITNSISELWVMQHYLRPDLLEDLQMPGVNAWAANFTESVSALDFSAGGKIKEKQRISRYVNVREITQLNAPFMDYVSRGDIEAKLPDLSGGAPTVIQFDPGQEVRDFARDLLWREDQLRKVDPQIDNPLKMLSDSRAATIDPRLAGLDYDPTLGRMKAVADNVAREWQEHKDQEYLDQHGNVSPNKGGLHIVFCDRGVPSSDPQKFTIYEALRTELVARGMDKERIRFIHDWETNKLQLFDDCNNGLVDVLIGNTAKLSTGANIQARAASLHHVDVPDRPADLEQRDGRIIRQGNQNEEVSIYHYVAEGTADAYLWGRIGRKASFINQIYQGVAGENSIDNDDGDEAVFARNKVLATGNPDFEKEFLLNNKVEELASKQVEHEAQRKSLEQKLLFARVNLPRDRHAREMLEPLLPQATQWLETASEDKMWVFGDVEFDDRKKAAEAMAKQLEVVAKSRATEPVAIGVIGGVPISAAYSYEFGSIFIHSPVGKHPSGIPENMIREDYVRRDDEQERRGQTLSGYLSRMESSVRGVLQRAERLDREISTNQIVLKEAETALEIGDFPQAGELESLKKELRDVQRRIAEFNESAGEKRAQAEFNDRLTLKGRSPGYTVELNPTTFMMATGIVCHPNSIPIVTPANQSEMWDDSVLSESNNQAADIIDLDDVRAQHDGPDFSLLDRIGASYEIIHPSNMDKQYEYPYEDGPRIEDISEPPVLE